MGWEGTARVLVTTGSGKFYSNGIDLEWVKTATDEQVRELEVGVQRVMSRLLRFPIPCVAAINGHAFGGGAAFAFCHDYRIMRSDRGESTIP